MTQSDTVGRPPKGKEAGAMRSIRIEADLWNAGKTAAASAGETITDALTDFIRWYTRQPGAKMPRRP